MYLKKDKILYPIASKFLNILDSGFPNKETFGKVIVKAQKKIKLKGKTEWKKCDDKYDDWYDKYEY